MSDDTSFGSLAWPEYTEDDLQSIDRLCEESRQNGPRPYHGAPSIPIELEGAADGYSKLEEGSQSVDKSAFSLFRERRGYLSVTDIVAPAWCEVQFAYGLQQFRNRPLSERPKSFVTSKGKEIHVKAAVATKNEQVLEKGRIVHKRLEKEIHKEEVLIKVKTKEESWALRLLDFLSRLKSCTHTLVCREVPVWGIVHDHAIYGVIDELRLEASVAPVPQQENWAQDSKMQTKPDSFIINARKIVHTSAGTPRFVLHIIDNKTRKSPGLPSHADSLPSRLQLMLYRLLFSQALSVFGDDSSFSAFCARTGANPTRPFSDLFISDMSSLVVENELSLHFLDAKCLEDMNFPYRESVKGMGLDAEGCVSTRLSIVYRLRGSSIKRTKSSTSTAAPTEKSAKTGGEFQPPVIVKEVSEDPDVSVVDGDAKDALPMDGSVDEVESVSQEDLIKTAIVEASGADTSGATVTADDAIVAAPIGTSRKRKRRKSRVSSTSNVKSFEDMPSDSSIDEGEHSSSEDPDISAAGQSAFILGTRKFQYDAALLNTHLSSVLAWWHGKRPAHGVSIEDTGRCNTCEYKNGCEWREQKALELMERTATNTVLDSSEKFASTS